MGYYFFVAADIKTGEETISASNITYTLLNKHFWAFSANAPVKQKLKSGDEILFYVGGKGKHYFIASGKIKTPIQQSSESQYKILRKLNISFLTHTVELKEIEWFNKEINILPLKDKLHFIKDKKNYGLALRLPVRQIDEKDYNLIISNLE